MQTGSSVNVSDLYLRDAWFGSLLGQI